MKFCGQIQLLPNFFGGKHTFYPIATFSLLGNILYLNKIILGIFENYPNVKNFVALLKNFTQFYIEQNKIYSNIQVRNSEAYLVNT